MNKLQIYHQPRRNHPDFWDSVTLSFYDYDEEKNTYKMKIVCEIRGQTFKHKELRNDLPVLADKLNQLDFSKYAMAKVSPDQSYFYIKYGEISATTASAESISDVLELFDFKMALDMFNKHMEQFND